MRRARRRRGTSRRRERLDGVSPLTLGSRGDERPERLARADREEHDAARRHDGGSGGAGREAAPPGTPAREDQHRHQDQGALAHRPRDAQEEARRRTPTASHASGGAQGAPDREPEERRA